VLVISMLAAEVTLALLRSLLLLTAGMMVELRQDGKSVTSDLDQIGVF